ncbi:hypothetical protein SAMN03159417_00371 [Ralstonia sp. NFACC01]|nr:hypothetical protein SAMN03159417_00371 [Ralstonia sp. NFACC01]
MAWYIDANRVTKGVADRSHWNAVHKPGETVPLSGIYRCTGCNKEVASNKGDPFPPQNHHQHGTDQPPIRWKLLVRAKTD